MLTWKFHTGPVYDVAFTPDGRLLTCSSDQLIRLWDVTTRIELHRWKCEHGTDNISISPDGKFIACCGGRAMVVWRTDGGNAFLRDKQCWAVAFRPDGKRLFAVGSSGKASVWSIPEGKPLARRWPIDGYNVAIHPVGEILATAFLTEDDDGRDASHVRLHTAATGKQLAVLTPSKRKEYGGPLTFSPDGRLLASLHAEAVVVWDVETRTEVVRRAPNRKEMKGVAFTADGQRLLTAGHDELVRVWAAPNWDEVTSFDWKIGRIKCLTVNREGTLAAAGGDRGKVVVWDLD